MQNAASNKKKQKKKEENIMHGLALHLNVSEDKPNHTRKRSTVQDEMIGKVRETDSNMKFPRARQRSYMTCKNRS